MKPNPIAQWYDAVPAEILVGLWLLREDLGVGFAFFDEFMANSLKEALNKFMEVEYPYDIPLYYRFCADFALDYCYYVYAPLARNTGFRGGLPYIEGISSGAAHEESSSMAFMLFIDRSYVRSLAVGGTTPQEAEENWQTVAKYLRRLNRRRQARSAYANNPPPEGRSLKPEDLYGGQSQMNREHRDGLRNQDSSL